MAAKKQKATKEAHDEVAPEAPEENQPAAESDVPAQDELKDQLLRALAEVENTKKRAEKEKQDMAKYATSGLARDLLTVADNLRRALDSLPEDIKQSDEIIQNFVTGVEMTEKELLSAFEKHNITKIDAVGQPFDYNLHQAVSEVETDEYPPGTVVQQIHSGYLVHDRLLRPAMVVVAKAGSAEKPNPDDIEGVDTTA